MGPWPRHTSWLLSTASARSALADAATTEAIAEEWVRRKFTPHGECTHDDAIKAFEDYPEDPEERYWMGSGLSSAWIHACNH